jgi:phage terminase large subunit-like protein
VVYCYEGDDIYNEDNWALANPSLGTTISLDRVREAAQKANAKPADERLFRWLRLNQWITTKLTSWLPLDLWDATVGSWARDEQLGKRCYLGLDLASTTDLTALAVLFPPQDKQLDWRIFWHCWLPRENMAERIRTDHIPYDLWEQQKWLTVTEGNVVDYTVIEETILEIAKFHKVIELDSDRAMATMLLQRLEKAGITCVDIPQTFVSLSDPMNQIEILLKGKMPAAPAAETLETGSASQSQVHGDQPEEIKLVTGKPLSGRMTHENNPVARWCFGNTSVAKNGQGYLKFVKEHKGQSVSRTKRIDLVAAWVDAMARARFYSSQGSVYESRGLVII